MAQNVMHPHISGTRARETEGGRAGGREDGRAGGREKEAGREGEGEQVGATKRKAHTTATCAALARADSSCCIACEQSA